MDRVVFVVLLVDVDVLVDVEDVLLLEEVVVVPNVVGGMPDTVNDAELLVLIVSRILSGTSTRDSCIEALVRAGPYWLTA